MSLLKESRTELCIDLCEKMREINAWKPAESNQNDKGAVTINRVEKCRASFDGLNFFHCFNEIIRLYLLLVIVAEKDYLSLIFW